MYESKSRFTHVSSSRLSSISSNPSFPPQVIDYWYKSTDKPSFAMSRKLIRKEGILCGGSSGTAMNAAVEAAKLLGPGQKCVVILPDGVCPCLPRSHARVITSYGLM